jgi:hypothetical protein
MPICAPGGGASDGARSYVSAAAAIPDRMLGDVYHQPGEPRLQETFLSS